jgi:hypothetical protein
MTQSAAATGLDQSVEGKDIRRAQFMDQLYDAVAGVVVELTPASAIGQALGWPGDETDRIILYLQGKGFIKIVTTDGLIQILQRGVDAVEDARRRPDTRTEHLPAYRDYHNTITITINAPVSNSPILAGSPGAVQTQSATITSQESTDIVQLLDLYREALDASPFTNQTDVETAAQVLDKIRAELNQPNPDRTSIQEGLNALGQLAIGVGASAAWSGVLAVLPHIHL